MSDTLQESTVNIGIYRTDESEFLDITNEDTARWMNAHYPAVLSGRPVGMSEKYQFMDSKAIISALNKMGMGLVSVGQQWSHSRNPLGQEHIMRFRFPKGGEFGVKQVGDSVPELVITNSHNGRSRIRAHIGFFRLVCMNGMVVADTEIGSEVMRHYGNQNTLEAFGKALAGLVRKTKVIQDRVKRMEAVMLTRHQQNTLARDMMKVRNAPKWLEPAEILEARRKEDERTGENGERSLWVTFNVLQENLTTQQFNHDRGGERPLQMRATTGAMKSLVLNEKLWSVLEKHATKLLPKEITDALDVEETPEERKRRKARERYHARKKEKAQA